MSGNSGDIMQEFDDLANAHFYLQERETAQELIRDAFRVLPWDLQADYRDIVQLHREGRFDEANAAWNDWIDNARDYGLV